MNKAIYEKPKLSMEIFETEDVITSSDPDGEGWTDFFPCSVEEETPSGRI